MTLYTNWLKTLAIPSEGENCNTTVSGMAYFMPPLEEERTASTYQRDRDQWRNT